MNSMNEPIDKNTSRLVKLTRDSRRPSEAFTRALMNNALQELQGNADPSQMKGILPMKKAHLFITLAASVFVVIGITVTMNRTPDQAAEPPEVAMSPSGLVPLPITLPQSVW